MSGWLKILVALLVTLPIGGYVVGTLIGDSPQDRGPREPVLLRDATPSPTPGSTPEGGADDPAAQPSPTSDDGSGDGGDDDVPVVKPEPTRIDDDGGDDPGTDDEQDDDAADDRTDDDSSEGGDD